MLLVTIQVGTWKSVFSGGIWLILVEWMSEWMNEYEGSNSQLKVLSPNPWKELLSSPKILILSSIIPYFHFIRNKNYSKPLQLME